MTLKEEVYNRCAKLVNEKVSSLQKTLHDLRESAANETKSTAGDKHETALAMLQIEQANTGRQLQEALKQKDQLGKIDINVHALNIVNGSLMKTNKGYFFVSIAIGKVDLNGIVITVLSPQSPLGSKLLGRNIGECIEMKGATYIIESFE